MENSIKQKIAMLIAEFFYSGRARYMPGTCGSLASLPIWFACSYYNVSIFLKLFLVAFFFALGIWASKYAIKFYGKADPKQVVIDEVVGQGIVFLAVSPNILEVMFAFFMFRFFDILKPWPIKKVEKSFKDEWGVMLDDVLAGIFALICHIILFR